MASHWTFLLAAGVLCAQAHAQFQPGVVVGAGYFTPAPRSGFTHEEQLCPEFGLVLGMKAGRSRLGMAVVHSTRNTTDHRSEATTALLVQEDQKILSVNASLFALFPLTKTDRSLAFLTGPALDLAFPYRTDVRRSYTQLPDEEESDAYINYSLPGMKAGVRLRAEWRFDVQWTPYAEMAMNYSFKQSFVESSPRSSYIEPPTDRLDYHLRLGVSILLWNEDCDCPAFH